MLNLKGSPRSVGIPSEAVHWLIDQLESGFTEPHGLMLMRHDKIFAEGWWSPFAPGIRHGLQSHTRRTPQRLWALLIQRSPVAE